MIDTGSTISAINATYFNKINNNQRIYPATTSCKTANNTRLNISGMVVLPIKINNIHIQMNIFIIEDLCTELLLGGDFCNKHNVNICYKEKYLLIRTLQQQTKVKFLENVNEQQTFNITTMHDITIPPLSSKGYSSIDTITSNVSYFYTIFKSYAQAIYCRTPRTVNNQRQQHNNSNIIKYDDINANNSQRHKLRSCKMLPGR